MIAPRPHSSEVLQPRAWWRAAMGLCACAAALVGMPSVLFAQQRPAPWPPQQPRAGVQAAAPSSEAPLVRRLPPVAFDPRSNGTTPTSPSVMNAVAVQQSDYRFANRPAGFAGDGSRPVPVTYQEEMPRPPFGPGGADAPSLTERLQIPAELPGTNVPPLWLPPVTQPDARLQAIETLFPDLPPMPKLLPPMDPQRVFTLSDLEQMALANSPIIAQAEANITVAMGQAWQAGMYPNPVIGYEADTVGSAGTRNYQGVFGTQTIKTANKLGLARSVANVDVTNSQLALRQARIDLMSQVKADYFAVLVAQESVMINEAVVRFTAEVYRIQDDKLKGGVITPYDPAQLRSLAVLARTLLVQAQMNYVAAWKALGVTLGMPGLPLTRLEGNAEMPVPKLTYEAALARMLSVHPMVQMARFSQGQARIQQRLERVKPIPDIDLYGTFQRDFTTPLTPRTTYNIQFGLPLPLWDRNRGNIMSATGNIVRTSEEIRRVEYDLTAQLVDAFTRFETSRILLQYNREQILPDLTRAYRGVYIRYQQEGEMARGKAGAVGFGDIIVAQQNLTNGLAAYVTLLGNQWTAVADLARLLQVESLAELNIGGDVPPNTQPVERAPR
ncbi:MAG: TolC family protein [Singulisphaera sp.]